MATDAVELYKLVLKLTDRISRLEKMMQYNQTMDDPSTNLTEWINSCTVTTDDVEIVYDNNGHINAMKNCIMRNHALSPIPMRLNKNTLYVYGSNGWEKWNNTTHMQELMRDIWCKFVCMHMHATPDPLLEDDMRDFQRARILEMRQQLYDVKKNRMEMYRWLLKIEL
jgi:hypothetical protein